MEKKSFYITTTLPYVNAEAHLGHALEFIRADIIARWKKSQGFEVFFNTGADEHGMKISEAAKKAGKSPQDYVDEYSKKLRELENRLGLSEDVHFIRTTDPIHEKAAQEFWRRVDKNGFIYKKNYKTKYCVGCEEEKTESELVNGCCPIHPNLKLEIIDEENYFFKFSAFGDKLLSFYKKNPDFVVPDFRFNEVKEFVKRGLEDFSISRLESKMPWGIPVPGDKSIKVFRDEGDTGKMLVAPKQPRIPRHQGKRLKHRMGGTANPAVRPDQMDSAGEGLRWNFRKPPRHFLEGRVVNAVASQSPPALDPKTAETAITVVNHNRFFGGQRIHVRARVIESYIRMSGKLLF